MPVLALPRVLTPSVAARCGVSPARVRTEIRRGNWHRLAAGVVLTRPDEATREDWADVGVHLGGPGAAITGWDALRVRGLGDRNPPGRVVVLTPNAMGRVVGGVRIRQTDRPFSRTMVRFGSSYGLLPVVPVARAVADAALDSGPLRTVAMVTQAVQQGRCTVEELRLEYEAGPRNRSAGLRRALSDVLDGARSVAEATAARRLSRGPVPAFELNVPVIDESGRLRYVVDQLWRELRAGVEIDSRAHHFSEQDWQRTLVRHNELTRAGLALLHYPPALITCRDSTFVPDVAQWLSARAAELGVSMPAGRGVRRPATGREPEPLRLRFGPQASAA